MERGRGFRHERERERRERVCFLFFAKKKMCFFL